jgi:hypothetical protein
MISSQMYFCTPAHAAKQIRPALSFLLRSNRSINRALRAAYRKVNWTKQTRKLLRQHLPR